MLMTAGKVYRPSQKGPSLRDFCRRATVLVSVAWRKKEAVPPLKTIF
jgi:hypothetical protein